MRVRLNVPSPNCDSHYKNHTNRICGVIKACLLTMELLRRKRPLHPVVGDGGVVEWATAMSSDCVTSQKIIPFMYNEESNQMKSQTKWATAKRLNK